MVRLSVKYNEKIECRVCPHYCRLGEGKTGICGVRRNKGNEIELLTYGVISALALDPVEKKPLYHFYPGTNIMSVGSYGCNMRCDFCQNFHISQNILLDKEAFTKPEDLVTKALALKNNTGIAFTYNEPVIWFEFVRDTAVEARKKGLVTAMISNGFVNSDILDEIISFTDAFNIDLKAFNNKFYRQLTGAEMDPVKAALKQIAASGRHLEITTLIIPGQNDSEKEMAVQTEWIAKELGEKTPFHLSRYFPMYKRQDPATDGDLLERIYHIASQNLNYVYLGNTMSAKGQNTTCPSCGTTVTIRNGYNTRLINLKEDGKCESCGEQVYRYFIFRS
ncbi:MAG TPA: AmmeMemoRadiSam system radical SAM enzyme [Bacteroidales bacterium]|nr:AmmeMemoRadiSam system radical SAM enzyme [Bacteroidales bacterium]